MKSILVLIVSIMTISVSTISAADTDVAAIFDGIEKYYAGFSTMQVEFKQVVEAPALEKKENYRGTMYFSKPGLLRLRYSVPAGQLLVVDGEYYWFYLPGPDIEQVMRAKVKSNSSRAPAYILGGDLKDKFNGSLVGRESVSDVDCFVIDLQPKSGESYYETLRAWIGVRDFSTRVIMYTDEGGTINRFDFLGTVYDVSLPDTLFKFVPPPGAQVMESE